jgi:hypothetical protein
MISTHQGCFLGRFIGNGYFRREHAGLVTMTAIMKS